MLSSASATPMHSLAVLLAVLATGSTSLIKTVDALISPEPVSNLLQTHASQIKAFQQQSPEASDVFCLRYCLAPDPESAWASAMEWRTSPSGAKICATAAGAVREATRNGAWENDGVLAAAPHAEAIGKFITPINCITTTTASSNKDEPHDLVYCIRAGAIEDANLMQAVTVDQMVEFFLYTKEVNAIVADLRSTEKLVAVVTCNDLSGVKLIGGSPEFRKALSESSTLASTVYPSTAGPTLLLNLPRLLNALVKLFTPLFPTAVKERLKFSQGPLKGVDNLMTVATGSSSPERAVFVQQLNDILY